MKEDRPDIYKYFGTYPTPDAKTLLDAFVSEGIDYTLDVNKMRLQNLDASQAVLGGSCGQGVGVAIGIHMDDVMRAMDIRQRVFKIMV